MIFNDTTLAIIIQATRCCKIARNLNLSRKKVIAILFFLKFISLKAGNDFVLSNSTIGVNICCIIEKYWLGRQPSKFYHLLIIYGFEMHWTIDFTKKKYENSSILQLCAFVAKLTPWRDGRVGAIGSLGRNCEMCFND